MKRTIASRFGKIPTESVRRRIFRFSHPVRLFDQTCCQTPVGNWMDARMSALAASKCSLASGSVVGGVVQQPSEQSLDTGRVELVVPSGAWP